jgi:hypothetical protein
MDQTEEIIDTRLEICKNCEFNVYDVKPNFNVCSKSEELPIILIIQKESCPIGKW